MITYADILDAQAYLQKRIRPTHFLDSKFFSHRSGANVWLALETTQRTGAYKIRGALNKMRKLTSEQLTAGVITASAGNHAAGVALAAQWLGCEPTIVMPVNTPDIKVVQTRLYGQNYDEASWHAHELQKQFGYPYIHPFDDDDVIAGQGTLGLEILEHHPDVDAILVPVGGGGLIAGICIAVKTHNPKVKIIGVNASGAASAVQAMQHNKRIMLEHVETIAEGIKVKQIGERPFAIMQQYLDRMVEVTDDEICEAVMHLAEKPKQLVEPAGAVGIAALLSGEVQLVKKKVVVVLSGANIDLVLLNRIIERGLRLSHRLINLTLSSQQELPALTHVLQGVQAQVLDVSVHRDLAGMSLADRIFHVELQTQDAAHVEKILHALESAGFRKVS